MFTNEFEFDETITTILDDGGEFNDVEIMIGDDAVYIRQWSDELDGWDLIGLSHKMYLEMIESRKYSEGFFKTTLGS